MNIKIKEFLGENYSIEDAILLREIVKNNLDTGITLDFDGLDRIPSTFLICLFNDLINKEQKRYFKRKMWSARNSFKAYYFNSKDYKGGVGGGGGGDTYLAYTKVCARICA